MSTDATALTRAGAHLVQFYEHDDELADRVVGYLRAALADRDAAVVIATPEHRALFAARLAEAGLDLDEARARGALIEVDAADTLAQIMVDGELTATGFEHAVGSLLRGLAAASRRVHAYGEMVALLWEAGSVARAIELEELWNRLRAELPFTLFCAYPNWLTATEDGVDAFADVCTAHSDVIAAAPPATTAEAARRFPRSPAAAAAARRFVRDWLIQHGHRELVEDAQLAVSELATNAVVHARSDFTVSLQQHADVIRIAVGDTSIDAPARRDIDDAASHGRGLAIVDALTAASGHQLLDAGKLVWAELAVSPRAELPVP